MAYFRLKNADSSIYMVDDEIGDDADGKADNKSIYTLPNLWRSATAVLYKISQCIAL